MYTWPDNMAVVPQYPDDSSALASDSDLNNRGKFRDQYPTQFPYIESQMQPVEMAGGLVGVMAPQVWNKQRAPTREEICAGKEDFWVRRDMLAIVREAVNAVAYFKDVTDEVTAKEKGNGKADEKPAEDEKKDKDAEKAKTKDATRKTPRRKTSRRKTPTRRRTRAPSQPKDKGAEKDKAPVKDKAAAKDKGKEVAQPKGPQGEKPSPANGYRHVFRNANWELDLRFEKAKEGQEVAARSHEEYDQERQRDAADAAAGQPEEQQGAGFPALPGQPPTTSCRPRRAGAVRPVRPDQGGPRRRRGAVNPERDFGLEQLLEWEMSPVRRHRIHRGAVPLAPHRHRPAEDPRGSQEARPRPVGGRRAGQGGGGGAGAGGGGAGGGMGGMGGGPPAPGGMGGGPPRRAARGRAARVRRMGGVTAASRASRPATSPRSTRSNRLRYLHVKEQARHLPVAMKLVVDQSHVHDVLGRRRQLAPAIQITQVRHATNPRDVQRQAPRVAAAAAATKDNRS